MVAKQSFFGCNPKKPTGFISIQHKTLQLEDDAPNISIGVRREAIAAQLSPLPTRLLPGVDAVRHREDEG